MLGKLAFRVVSAPPRNPLAAFRFPRSARSSARWQPRKSSFILRWAPAGKATVTVRTELRAHLGRFLPDLGRFGARNKGLCTMAAPLSSIIPTSEPTVEQIDKAEHERYWRALRIAMAQSGPYPDELADRFSLARWEMAVNRRFWKVFRRLN